MGSTLLLLPLALLLAASPAACMSAAPSAGRPTPIFERPGGRALLDSAVTLSSLVANASCPADVCFALAGGGGLLTSGDYRAQLEFAQLLSLAAGADASARFGAAQAAGRVLPVSNLTDADSLVVKLGRTPFARAEKAFPAAAALFCARMLWRQGSARNAKKIVLFTGTDEPFRPRTLEAVTGANVLHTQVLQATVGFGRPEVRRPAGALPLAGATTAAGEVAATVDVSVGADLSRALTTAVEFICGVRRR